MTKRCDWVPKGDQLYESYHDHEWGVPVQDEQKWFEFLILETFQAGLSWRTVLYKRDNFRLAFDHFDPQKVVQYDQKKIDALLDNTGIIRNRLKVHAAVSNARAFLDIQQEYGSFNTYMWQFTGGSPIQNSWEKMDQIPANTPLSDQISKDLKSNGFKFVGSTVVYAHMQATGMVNDHTTDCFRYHQVQDIK